MNNSITAEAWCRRALTALSHIPKNNPLGGSCNVSHLPLTPSFGQVPACSLLCAPAEKGQSHTSSEQENILCVSDHFAAGCGEQAVLLKPREVLLKTFLNHFSDWRWVEWIGLAPKATAMPICTCCFTGSVTLGLRVKSVTWEATISNFNWPLLPMSALLT